MKKREKKEIIYLSIDEILEPISPIRITIDSNGIFELQESIRRVGLLSPLVARKRGEKYEIVAGHRRYLALRGLGYATVPAIVLTDEKNNGDIARIHENLYREDISPLEEARYYDRMHRAGGKEYTAIARIVGKSESYISQRISILNSHPVVQAALQEKKITFTQAREIAQAHHDIQKRLTQITIENGASPRSIRLMREDLERAVTHTPHSPEEEAPSTKTRIETTSSQTRTYLCPACASSFPITRIEAVPLCRDCAASLRQALTERRRQEGDTNEM